MTLLKDDITVLCTKYSKRYDLVRLQDAFAYGSDTFSLIVCDINTIFDKNTKNEFVLQLVLLISTTVLSAMTCQALSTKLQFVFVFRVPSK